MNQRTDFINSLSYRLIEQNYLLPVRVEGQLPIVDTYSILQRDTKSELFAVKILDGNSITAENIQLDITAMYIAVIKRRAERQKPLVASYVIVVGAADRVSVAEETAVTAAETNAEGVVREAQYAGEATSEESVKATADGTNSEAQSDIFQTCKRAVKAAVCICIKDVGISATVLDIASGSSYTVNCNRRSQKRVRQTVTEELSSSSEANYKHYTREDIIGQLDNISKSASKVEKIKGFSVTKVIIAINILLYIVGEFMMVSAGIDIYDYGEQVGNYIIHNGEYWRLITPVFLHGDIVHLMSNAYFIYLFGEMIESIYGRTKFLIIYFVTGIAGNVLSLFLLDPQIASLGASGAGMGLGGVMLYLWLKKKGNYLRYFQNLAPMIGIIVFNAFYGFLLPQLRINNWAHLGGFIAGIAAGLLFDKLSKSKSQEHKSV